VSVVLPAQAGKHMSDSECPCVRHQTSDLRLVSPVTSYSAQRRWRGLGAASS